MVNSVCERFDTISAVEHNPSSRTSNESWHGTAISATQHLEHEDDGAKHQSMQLTKTSTKELKALPKAYPCSCNKYF